MPKQIRVALAGNPNSGKTTIFNNLVGARQHVGNYPGVTVEKKEGSLSYNDFEIKVIDLPGTYSLTSYSIDEMVARNFIIEEKPDVVVDIIDTSNLERNLYLAVQFMELGVPLVLAFNMSDVVEKKGINIDVKHLSDLLGVPIIPTVGHKGKGMKELLDAVIEIADQKKKSEVNIRYGDEVEKEIEKIQGLIKEESIAINGLSPRWIALKMLENDKAVKEKIRSPKIISAAEKGSRNIQVITGDIPEIIIAEKRYGFISGACQKSVTRTVEERRSISDRIDKVLANRFLGLPIFLALMYLVFHLSFTYSELPMDWIESFFGWLGETVTNLWPKGEESVLKSLLVDGVIAGVGGVLVFLPIIFFLFFFIAILEDSGYMARAAFIMDRIMHKVGLHGKSFIPMLIGFGCNVPAIMATRTIENKADRFTTIMVNPLISCGARLPIYALIIPAFFPERLHTEMLWLIYIIGIGLAILGAWVLRNTVFEGESAPFVMELPPYRVPTIRGILVHMWERAWLYLKKAGLIILTVSIILWFFTSYPKPPESQFRNLSGEQKNEIELSYSIAGRIGHGLEPILKPIGFDWRIGTALIGAFAAKEVFVSQMAITFAVGEEGGEEKRDESLRSKLRDKYNPLIGFCIMLFSLITAPCMVTIAVTKKETGSWKWALAQLFGLTALAYVITFIVYQAGLILKIGIG